MIFKKSPFEVNIDFWSDFDANLPPCWPPKSKIFQNSGVPRRLKIFIDFGIDFLSILGPSWPPTWSHLGSQDGSKSEKMDSKKGHGAPQERFWKRRCFWTPFKTVLPSILGVSGLDFRRFWDSFGVVRARFWGCQGSIWGLSGLDFSKLPQESLDHKVKVSFRPQPRNTKMT